MKKVIIVLCMSLLVACSTNHKSSETPEQPVKTMIVVVGPEKVDCVGVAPMKCLVVDGGFFYEPIKGFDFKQGYDYKLEIQRIQLYTESTVPADANLYEYRLIKVLSKTKSKS